MEKVRAAVDRVLEGVLMALVTIMVVNVLWQVATRFVLKNPSSYTEELARFILIWLSLLGASYATGKRLHLALDILTRRFTDKARIYSELFIQLCIFLFALFVMVLGGLQLMSITLSLRQISAALQVQLGYVYLAVPLSGLLMMFYSGLFFINRLREIRRPAGASASAGA